MQTNNFGYIWYLFLFLNSASLHPANAAYSYMSHYSMNLLPPWHKLMLAGKCR